MRASPRIYCLPATGAPIVGVLRRGPSRWFHVGRWDLDALRYETGAWFKGRLYPRRCDLSPDGRLLCYFALQAGADWEHGETFVAISRLPWLQALHAFGTCGTWTRGYHFTEGGDSEHDEDADLPMTWGLRSTPVLQFASERRRGWVESPDSEPRRETDTWDEQRQARLHKPQPGGERVLHLENLRWSRDSEAGPAVDGMIVAYTLEHDGDLETLTAQWADWDARGRLLLATRDGRLQIRDLDVDASSPIFDHDLSRLEPDPQPAPGWAADW